MHFFVSFEDLKLKFVRTVGKYVTETEKANVCPVVICTHHCYAPGFSKKKIVRLSSFCVTMTVTHFNFATSAFLHCNRSIDQTTICLRLKYMYQKNERLFKFDSRV